MDPAAFFDEWRARHGAGTYAEEVRWYEEVYAHWPTQRHFHVETLDQFCREVAPSSVLELGGWDGYGAGLMLDRYPIERWTNYEVCLSATLAGLKHPRYQAVIANDWAWNIPLPEAEAFVATHVIEHLRAADLQRLIERLPVRWCHVEAPIPRHARDIDWRGYIGSHVLEIGWHEVEAMFAAAGFGCVHRVGQIRWFCRGA